MPFYSDEKRIKGDLEGVIICVSFVGVTVLLELREYLVREGTESVRKACVIEASTSDLYWEEHKFSQGDTVYMIISNVTVFPSKELL